MYQSMKGSGRLSRHSNFQRAWTNCRPVCSEPSLLLPALARPQQLSPMPKYSLLQVSGTGEEWRLPTARCCPPSCAAPYSRGESCPHVAKTLRFAVARCLATHILLALLAQPATCELSLSSRPSGSMCPLVVAGSALCPQPSPCHWPLALTRAGVGAFAIYLAGRGKGFSWFCY